MRHVNEVGGSEAVAGKKLAPYKRSRDDRQMLFVRSSSLLERLRVPSIARQEAFRKNDRAGVAGQLDVARLHMHIAECTGLGFRREEGRLRLQRLQIAEDRG